MCTYDLFFVIYHVLTNFMYFLTYLFDLIAYCSSALFMTNSAFNPTCADDGHGPMNMCMYVYMKVQIIIFK